MTWEKIKTDNVQSYHSALETSILITIQEFKWNNLKLGGQLAKFIKIQTSLALESWLSECILYKCTCAQIYTCDDGYKSIIYSSQMSTNSELL